MTTPAVGDRVRIERDETRYPSRGTWPELRGRVGTVVEINEDRKRPQLTEYGVSFGPTRCRPDGSLHGDDVVTWFKLYEITALAPVRHAEAPRALPGVKTPGRYELDIRNRQRGRGMLHLCAGDTHHVILEIEAENNCHE